MTAPKSLFVDGQRLEVFVQGSGPPCILLHGYPQDHRCWKHIAPKLATMRTVYTPDWFGWGESEKSLTHSFRYEDEFARVGMLMDALELNRVDLVGHDYGGLLALAYAVYFPQRVERLALINTRAHGAIALPTRVLLDSMTLIARFGATRWLISHLPLYEIHNTMFQRYVQNGSFTPSELDGYLSWMKTDSGKLWFARFYEYFRTTPRDELGSAADKLTMPCAIIWGDQDPYFPFSIGQDLAKRVPRNVLTQIQGGDHFILEERPDEVAQALIHLMRTEP